MRALRPIAVFCVMVVFLTLMSCGSADTRTVLNVWSWEPSMKSLVARFEAANPDIRINLNQNSDYEKLNTEIQDGYGTPDVVQLEYFALQQYAVSGQLLDLTKRTTGYDAAFTPGTWSSVKVNDRVYGLPMDSGPMAFFYNQSVFDQVGIDASSIHTWDQYYQAAKKLKSIGVYIASDSGDASFYNAMIWLAGGRPYRTARDGKTVTVNLTDDQGTKTFTAFWQKMIDEGLIDIRLRGWSPSWKKALGVGNVASVFAGAWMPSLLLSDLPGTAGLWRVAPMPTADGTATNAENGGSSLGILQSSRKPDAAFRFVSYVCHNPRGIEQRVDHGAFPADNATLHSSSFLDKTTITDERGMAIAYFGGQRFNEVLAQAAQTVSVGYQYLPFEVYARNDFSNTVGKAYAWAKQYRVYAQARALSEAGQTNADGSKITVPKRPADKVSVMDGITKWQKDIQEYGINQGFTLAKQP